MEEKDAFGKERLSFGNERVFLYQNSVTFYPIFEIYLVKLFKKVSM